MKKRLMTSPAFLIVFGILLIILLDLWKSGFFLYDPTANISLEYVQWNGRTYSATQGAYTEGRTLAKDKSKKTINMVKEDPTNTFIVVRSFLEQALLVADDYDVPTSGNLTSVSWGGVYITDTMFLNAVSKIDANKNTSFTYNTDGIFLHTENQHMKTIYFAYNNCPVATNFKGYMGKVNGEWVITTHISSDKRNDDGSPKPYPVSCYKIPGEFSDIISKHFD